MMAVCDMVVHKEAPGQRLNIQLGCLTVIYSLKNVVGRHLRKHATIVLAVVHDLVS